MAKLYSECTVHVHCAKNASIYTMNYFGDLETSLVSKYTPLFFLFAEIHFSACFLHVHVFCMFCMFCMFSACFLHVFASTSKGGNWLPGKPKVSLENLGCPKFIPGPLAAAKFQVVGGCVDIKKKSQTLQPLLFFYCLCYHFNYSPSSACLFVV